MFDSGKFTQKRVFDPFVQNDMKFLKSIISIIKILFQLESVSYQKFIVFTVHKSA